MRAIVQTGYGSPEVLELRDLPKPEPRDGDVVVRVHAAALHAGDLYVMRGVPYLARLSAGWPRPKGYVPGFDAAGVVDAVGKGVDSLRVGDEVFGACTGACAEYVRADAGMFVPKPPALTFEEAAAVPTSALAALHGLRDAGKVHAGQDVLVVGASGGVGSYAVQIAKWLGARVTGVCGTANVDLVRSLGADEVIDYTTQDFTATAERYDVILDNVANRSFAEVRRALKPTGKLIPNSGDAGLGYFITAFGRSLFVSQQGRPYLSTPNHEDLLVLKDLLETGRLRPVVGRTYPLAQVPEALAYIGTRHTTGKVVILV